MGFEIKHKLYKQQFQRLLLQYQSHHYKQHKYSVTMLSQSMIDKFTKKIQSVPSYPNQKNNVGHSPSELEESNEFFPPSGSSRNEENGFSDLHGQEKDADLNGKVEAVQPIRNIANCMEEDFFEKSPRFLGPGLYDPSKVLNEESENFNEGIELNLAEQEYMFPKEQSEKKQQLFAKAHENHKKPPISISRKTVPLFTIEDKIKQLIKNTSTQDLQLPLPPTQITIHPEGKNLPENYKRQFSQRLLTITEGLESDEMSQVIKKSGKKIQVYPYEVRLWMVAYQIIKKVEESEREAKEEGSYMRAENKFDIIRKELLTFLQENLHQKKYRVIKILNHIFKVLEISENKTKEWLKKFIDDNKEQLIGLDFQSYGITSPDRDEFGGDEYQSSESDETPKPKKKTKHKKLLRNDSNSNECNSDSEQQPQNKKLLGMDENAKIREDDFSKKFSSLNEGGQSEDDLMNHKQKNKKQIIVKKKNHKDELRQICKEEADAFPEFFKKNVAAKLDSLIKQNIDKLLAQKAEQMCIRKQTLFEIHKAYGGFSHTRENSESSNDIKTENSKKQKEEREQINSKQNASKRVKERDLGEKSKRTSSKDQILNFQKNQTEKVPERLQVRKNNEQKQTAIKIKPSMLKPIIPEFPKQKKQIIISDQRLLQLLESYLSAYMKKNPNYHIKDLQKMSDGFMDSHSFSTMLKNEVRSRWFAFFIRKYGVKIPKDLQGGARKTNKK